MVGIITRVRQWRQNRSVERQPAPPAIDPNSTPIDQEIAKLDAGYFREDALKRVESCSQFAQSIWRGLTIVNGGAIVAMFTLIGAVGGVEESWALWLTFGCYCMGLAFALASNILGYVTQGRYLQGSIQIAWNMQEQMHGRISRWDHTAT